jgi:hypothetical protein
MNMDLPHKDKKRARRRADKERRKKISQRERFSQEG